MANSMKFYCVYAETGDGPIYSGTLAEAKKIAREHADVDCRDVEIERVECGMNRASIINLANHAGGWCISSELVIIIKPSRGRHR